MILKFLRMMIILSKNLASFHVKTSLQSDGTEIIDCTEREVKRERRVSENYHIVPKNKGT